MASNVTGRQRLAAIAVLAIGLLALLAPTARAADVVKTYAVAAKRVAIEENIPLIDLNAESVKLLETMNQESADGFDAEAHSDAIGKGPDRTHLNAAGSAVFGRMVADGLAKVCVELGPDVKGSPK